MEGSGSGRPKAYGSGSRKLGKVAKERGGVPVGRYEGRESARLLENEKSFAL
jgi:hypothetical protein